MLLPEELTRVEERPTESPEAYDYYLLAKVTPSPENLALLERATQLDPDFYDAWHDLAYSKLFHWRFINRGIDTGLIESAYDALDEVEHISPQSGRSLSLRASFSDWVEEDLEKALFYDMRANSLGVGGKDVGLRYVQMGKLELGKLHTEESLLEDPLDQQLTIRLYFNYLYLGMWEAAQSLLENFQSKTGEPLIQQKFHMLSQHEFLRDGDLNKYIDESKKALSLVSTSSAQIWKSMLLRDINKVAELVETFEGRWFDMIGPATSTYERGLLITPPELFHALIWFDLGDREKAVQAAEKARNRQEPLLEKRKLNLPAAWSLTAITYALKNDFEKVESLISVIREHTQRATYKWCYQVLCDMHIAIAYLVLGKHDKAIETLEAASKLEGPIFLTRELQLWFIFDSLKGNPRFEAWLEDE